MDYYAIDEDAYAYHRIKDKQNCLCLSAMMDEQSSIYEYHVFLE